MESFLRTINYFDNDVIELKSMIHNVATNGAPLPCVTKISYLLHRIGNGYLSQIFSDLIKENVDTYAEFWTDVTYFGNVLSLLQIIDNLINYYQKLTKYYHLRFEPEIVNKAYLFSKIENNLDIINKMINRYLNKSGEVNMDIIVRFIVHLYDNMYSSDKAPSHTYLSIMNNICSHDKIDDILQIYIHKLIQGETNRQVWFDDYEGRVQGEITRQVWFNDYLDWLSKIINLVTLNNTSVEKYLKLFKLRIVHAFFNHRNMDIEMSIMHHYPSELRDRCHAIVSGTKYVENNTLILYNDVWNLTFNHDVKRYHPIIQNEIDRVTPGNVMFPFYMSKVTILINEVKCELNLLQASIVLDLQQTTLVSDIVNKYELSDSLYNHIINSMNEIILIVYVDNIPYIKLNVDHDRVLTKQPIDKFKMDEMPTDSK